jgi:hypothetical protein
MNTDIVDNDGNTILYKGDEVEVYKSKKIEKFKSGIGVFVISDNGIRDWICASQLTRDEK